MKNLLAVVIAFALGFGAFAWYDTQKTRESDAAARELATAARDLASITRNAQAVAEENSRRFKASAYISEGLAAAANVKTRVVEFYFETGKFPSSNEELGLPEAERFAGQSLTSLAISEGGVITVAMNELSGVRNGIIRLLPDDNNPAMGVQWRCETPSYRDIGGWAPQCRYAP